MVCCHVRFCKSHIEFCTVRNIDAIYQAPPKHPEDVSIVTESSKSGDRAMETEAEDNHPTAEDTIPTVPRRPKCFATSPTRKKILGAVRAVIEGGTHGEAECEVKQVTLLAQGGYNNVWLVEFNPILKVSTTTMSSSSSDHFSSYV